MLCSNTKGAHDLILSDHLWSWTAVLLWHGTSENDCLSIYLLHISSAQIRYCISKSKICSIHSTSSHWIIEVCIPEYSLQTTMTQRHDCSWHGKSFQPRLVKVVASCLRTCPWGPSPWTIEIDTKKWEGTNHTCLNFSCQNLRTIPQRSQPQQKSIKKTRQLGTSQFTHLRVVLPPHPKGPDTVSCIWDGCTSGRCYQRNTRLRKTTKRSKMEGFLRKVEEL